MISGQTIRDALSSVNADDVRILVLGSVPPNIVRECESRGRITRLDRPQEFTPVILDDTIGLPGDLDFQAEEFHLIVGMHWLEEATFFRWALQEMLRVLRVDGMAFLTLEVPSNTTLLSRFILMTS